MKNSEKPPIIVCTENEGLAKKNNTEGKIDFRKSEIEGAFVDVDEQLKQLAEMQDPKQIKHIIPNIRNRLFELCCIWVHGLDVKNFASHEAGDKTLLNSECA